MDERDASVGGAPLPTPKRPTIIRPASKTPGVASHDEQVPNNYVTSSTAPLTPGTRPPPPSVHRPNEPVKSEPPPRSESRPFSVNNSASSFKAAGEQPGKKPISESGFRDVKGTAVNSPASEYSVAVSDHPASVGGTHIQNALIIDHPEGLPRKPAGLPAEKVDDDDDNDSGSLKKPLVPLRPMKPTIIRPNVRSKMATDQTSAGDVTSASSQNPTPVPSSFPTPTPSVPTYPSPSPKPRSRDTAITLSEKKKGIHVAAVGKPLQTPPSRPSSSPKSDLSSLKSSSVQRIYPELPEQPLPVQVSSHETSNLHSSSKSSSAVKAPMRPSGPPRSSFLGNIKPKDQKEVSSKTETIAEGQFSQAELRSAVVSEGVGSVSPTQIEHGSLRTESSDNKSVLPKPKPKPRPKSLASPGIKEGTVVNSKDSGGDIGVNVKSVPLDLPLLSLSHDTKQGVVLRQNPSPATSDVNDRIDQTEHDSAAGKPKHLSKAFLARFETSTDNEAGVKSTTPSSSSSLPETVTRASRQSQVGQTKTDEHKFHLSSNSDSDTAQHPKADNPESARVPAPLKKTLPVADNSVKTVTESKTETTVVSDEKIKQESIHNINTSHVARLNQTNGQTNVSQQHGPTLPRLTPAESQTVPAHSPPVGPHPPPAHSPHVSQMPATTATESNISPSQTALTKNNQLGPPAPQKPVRHGNPPSRPTTAAPVKGKSTSFSDKHLPRSDYTSSSTSEGRAETNLPSRPVTSRAQKKPAEPPSLPGRPGPGHPLYSYMSRQPHGIALHDYIANQPDELSFSEGDVVVLVREIDESWMVGRVGDEVGMYPVAFVEIKYPIGGQKLISADSLDSWSLSRDQKDNAETVTGARCRARFDFEGEGQGELALEDGEVIQITERVGTEWLRGQCRGRQGIFPSSFVEIIEDLPADNSKEEHMLSNCVSTLFDFDGKDGELTFKTGDTVTVISQVNSEWLYGDLSGHRGQFPAAFVTHIPPNLPKYEPENSPKGRPKQSQDDGPDGKSKENKSSLDLSGDFWDSREPELGFCIAMFDYLDPSPGDLKFRQGDRIKILEFIGEDWARGRLGNKEGMFPLRFVAEELNSPPCTPEPEVVKKVFGKVLHDFDGETADDLVIKEGDLIEVEDFADINKNWRWGSLNGKRGMFPTDFVQILE